MTALKIKGEVLIVIGEKEYIMRPTFEKLAKIEQEAGKPLQLLASDGMLALLSYQDTFTTLKIALEDDFSDFKVLFDAINEEGGYINFMTEAAKFIVVGITGGKEIFDDIPEKKK